MSERKFIQVDGHDYREYAVVTLDGLMDSVAEMIAEDGSGLVVEDMDEGDLINHMEVAEYEVIQVGDYVEITLENNDHVGGDLNRFFDKGIDVGMQSFTFDEILEIKKEEYIIE